jgi:zinc protease
VKIENLQAFYRMYYQPDNAVLLVAGKFDEAKALAMVAKHFGAIPKPSASSRRFGPSSPRRTAVREFTVRRKGDIQIVGRGATRCPPTCTRIPTPSRSPIHPGDAPSGRLHKALVETGKAAQVVGYPLMGVDPGLHIFGAVVKKGDPVEPIRDEIVKIVEGFADNPPTKEEIARALKSYQNQAEKTLNNHESIGLQLSEYIALGDWRLFLPVARRAADSSPPRRCRRRRRPITAATTAPWAIFIPEDNPLRAEIPASPTLAEVMKDFKPKEGASRAEAFDPSQANIDARTKRFEVGGVKVALLPKKTRGETVNVSLSLQLGN